MIKVLINKKNTFLFLHGKLFNNIANEVVASEKIDGDAEVNVLIVNDEAIKDVSKQYKKKDKATDVLSFPADWKLLEPMLGYNMFGDIYISKEKVIAQAKEYNHSTKREWAYLFTHGMFHLLGYDHLNKKEEKIMNDKAEKIMAKLKVRR